jgi:hypothetical protein
VVKPLLMHQERLDRLERAVETMAQWLVEAQTGFGIKDYEGIKAILDGTDKEEETEKT